MDITLFQSFITIVEEGSLNKAAKTLHVAQPALSHQLKVLQEQYGTPLVHTKQGKRTLTLTPAGHIFYAKAKHITAMYHSLREDIEGCRHGQLGNLRIALSPSVSAEVIENYLIPFQHTFPAVTFTLEEISGKEQHLCLQKGDAEIGISNAPLADYEHFIVHHSIAEPLALVISQAQLTLHGQDLPFPMGQPQKRQALTLAQLQNMLPFFPLCLTKGCSQHILSFCAEAGISLTPLCITTTKNAALTWVRQGACAAIVPISAQERLESTCYYYLLPYDSFIHHKILYTVKDRPLSVIAKHFLETYLQNF